jgi:hypothetical protein
MVPSVSAALTRRGMRSEKSDATSCFVMTVPMNKRLAMQFGQLMKACLFQYSPLWLKLGKVFIGESKRGKKKSRGKEYETPLRGFQYPFLLHHITGKKTYGRRT